MTAIELAKLLARHIAQGRGDWEISIFQWEHGQQPATSLEVRPGGQLELYSGTNDPGGVEDLDDLI